MAKPAPMETAKPRQTDWKVMGDEGSSFTVRMPVEDWIRLPGHPRQRDIERHSRKGHWKRAKHAQGPVLENLRWVVAAEFGGKICKVDGHTRAMLWDHGGLRKPESVYVIVHRCQSKQELYELYTVFDTQSASETMYDRVTGAYRQHGMAVRSARLSSGTIVDALAIATRGVARTKQKGTPGEDELDVYDAVGRFRDEIMLLDSVDPRNDEFYTGIVAAALLTLALDPKHLDFFAKLSRREGCKQGKLLDPVQALLNMIASLKKEGGAWGAAEQEQLCAAAITGASFFMAGAASPVYWVKETLPPGDISAAVQRVRELKIAGE